MTLQQAYASRILIEQTPNQSISSTILSHEELEVLSFLQVLSPEYPTIDNWFVSKVVPGLRLETRRLVRIERNGQLAAIGIGKIERGEKKICTVRVAPEHFGRGLGIRIFDSLIDWLGTSQPHATVSEDRLPEFERIFSHYGFRLTSVCTGMYRAGKSEFMFNEPHNPWL